MQTPNTLQELLDLMRDGDPYVFDDRGDWSTSLPNFGGEEPEDTTHVWSWDETHLLVGTCADDLRLVPHGDISPTGEWCIEAEGQFSQTEEDQMEAAASGHKTESEARDAVDRWLIENGWELGSQPGHHGMVFTIGPEGR